jgi:hypothetical protein
VEGHTAAQQREIEIRELDPTDEGFVGAADEKGAEREGEHRAHDEREQAETQQDPAPTGAQEP